MTQVIIGDIRRDVELQPRAMMNAVTIAEYAEEMEGGAAFPPVVVFGDGQAYWLADGFHRVEAAERLGWRTIEAEVRQGGKREAILWSVQANCTHGLRRSDADKRKAVLTLLEDPEWAGWSDHEIARRTGTSHTFVAGLRPLTGNGASERTYVTRHGTVATMATGKIAASNSARAVQSEEQPEAVAAEGVDSMPPAGNGSNRWAPPLTPSPRAPEPESVPEDATPLAPRQPSVWAPELGAKQSVMGAVRATPTLPAPQAVAAPRDTILTVRFSPDYDELATRRLLVSIGEDGKGPGLLFRGMMVEMHRLIDRALGHQFGAEVVAIVAGNGHDGAVQTRSPEPERPFAIGSQVKWGSGRDECGTVTQYSTSGSKVYVTTLLTKETKVFPVYMLRTFEAEAEEG